MPTRELKTKILTFESWVTNADWYDYAVGHPLQVPQLLIDRSPCQEPFFDPYAPSTSERVVLISGLCRLIKHFAIGDKFFYVTKIDEKLYSEFRIPIGEKGAHYFGVAALQIVRIFSSHLDAAEVFSARHYVVEPILTGHPPNIAETPQPSCAVARECCIIHVADGEEALNYELRKPLIPSNATEANWREAYLGYYNRQKDHSLRVAQAQLEQVDGHEALRLDPQTAPIFTSKDWGGKTLNVQGIRLKEDAIYERMAAQLAYSRA